MRISLVLTVLGDDRPGLIEGLSQVLTDHQGNWLESRIVDLAGKCAGLLRVTVPEIRKGELLKALSGLEGSGLSILVQEVADEEEQTSPKLLQLEVLGPDSPGIINNITVQLAKLRVNIQELTSEQREAPMSAEQLFCADMTLELPDDVTEEEVQDALEALSDQLMVDLNFG